MQVKKLVIELLDASQLKSFGWKVTTLAGGHELILTNTLGVARTIHAAIESHREVTGEAQPQYKQLNNLRISDETRAGY